MPRNLLTDKAIQTAAKEGLKRLTDGDGLYLLLNVNGGSHGWRLDYSFGGKRKTLSLGTYPDTSLALARSKAGECRQMIAQGVDPSAQRKAKKQDQQASIESQKRVGKGLPALGSLEAIAREWHSTVHTAKVSEGHAERTLIRLEQDVFPWLGAMKLAEVSATMLLEVLHRVEKRGTIETAHRIRQA